MGATAERKTDLCVHIGEMGRYQWQVFVAIFVFAMFTVDSIHIVFIGADMDHWCRVDELAGLPADVQRRLAIPPSSAVRADGQPVSGVEYSKCEMYDMSNYSSILADQLLLLQSNESVYVNVTGRRTVPCSNGWVYDTSRFSSTIVKKVGLRYLNCQFNGYDDHATNCL